MATIIAFSHRPLTLAKNNARLACYSQSSLAVAFIFVVSVGLFQAQSVQ